MYVCLLLFIGTDCKIERVGITTELTFKQPFANQSSSEFKGLESPLLSAVSYFEHAFRGWDQMYMALTVPVYTIHL